MTREEAIKILKAIRVYECYPKSASEETKEAIDMAIEALADRTTGEWMSNYDGSWNCSECGLRVFIYAKGNYCPNCGTKMYKGGDDE